MTPKQQRFVEAYLANGGNATQAARTAGYSQHTAHAIGQENLRKPIIAAAIVEAGAKGAAKSKVTVERIAAEMASIAFAKASGKAPLTWGNKIAALDQLAQYVGMYKQTALNPNDARDKDDEQLKADIRRELERRELVRHRGTRGEGPSAPEPDRVH